MKPIPGYERYLASIDGDIIGVRGWVLEPGRPLNGYLTVGLYAKGDKNPTTLYLHRVIAATYLGLDLLDTDTQVNHKNGVKTDCAVTNLELCTQSENIIHRISLVYTLDTDTHKQCRNCNEVKHVSNFVIRTKSRDGLSSYCKSCWSTYIQSRRSQN